MNDREGQSEICVLLKVGDIERVSRRQPGLHSTCNSCFGRASFEAIKHLRLDVHRHHATGASDQP